MAEETLDTPEKHVLEDNCASDFRSPNNRRLSVGSHLIGSSPRRNSMTKSDSGQKPVPNYMRASIGSCHDLCKYGKKDTFEVLEEKPWKAIRKGTSSAASLPKREFVHIKVPEPKKEQFAKIFLDAKTYSPRQNTPSNNMNRSPRVPKKDPSPEPPEVIKKVILPPSPKMDKRDSSVGVKVLKTDEKTDSGLDKGSPIKSKSMKRKQLPPSIKSNGAREKEERMGNFKTERKKVLAPGVSASPPKLHFSRTVSIERKKTGTLKVASLMRDHNKTRMPGAKASNDKKVFEKILHVDKEETGSLSKNAPNSKDTEMKESYTNEPMHRVVSVKLQFRSGKVIEFRSDTNAPKRLRFRKAKAAPDEDDKGGVLADVPVGGHTSRKVVMKHPGAKGKKKAEVLLNNVIEETASKLEESRKSKVKALVGAFETVISLQEVTSS